MAQTFFQRLVSIVLLVPALAFAWEPTKPIEGVMAHTPGSVNELAFRALALEVEKNTGAKFIVTNHAGVGGVIGTMELQRRPADGYSVTMASIPGLTAMDKIAMPNKPYTTDSFEYPFLAAQSPFAIVANIKDPVKTPAEFLETLKYDKVSVGATGGARIVYETLRSRLNFVEGRTGVVRVDYKGPVDALTDVISGNVRYAIIPALIAQGMYLDHKVNIIAISSKGKIKQFPNVPTISSVLPKFDIVGTWGLLLPKGTPPDVIEWYRREFTKAVQSNTVRKVYEANLLEYPKIEGPTKYQEYVINRENEWKPLVDSVLEKINK